MEDFSDELWEVLALYGRLMREVQIFEMGVRGLFAFEAEGDNEESLEDATERLFRRPLAKLAKQLDLPAQTLEELKTAVNTRNTLAHEYFPLLHLQVHAEITTIADEILLLSEVYERYAGLNTLLSQRNDAHAEALGLGTEVTSEEIEVIARNAIKRNP